MTKRWRISVDKVKGIICIISKQLQKFSFQQRFVDITNIDV